MKLLSMAINNSLQKFYGDGIPLLSMPNNQSLLRQVPFLTVIVHEFACWGHVGWLLC